MEHVNQIGILLFFVDDEKLSSVSFSFECHSFQFINSRCNKNIVNLTDHRTTSVVCRLDSNDIGFEEKVFFKYKNKILGLLGQKQAKDAGRFHLER